jgi:hypothetical protein
VSLIFIENIQLSREVLNGQYITERYMNKIKTYYRICGIGDNLSLPIKMINEEAISVIFNKEQKKVLFVDDYRIAETIIGGNEPKINLESKGKILVI